MLGAQNEFTEDNDLYKLAIESREMFPKLSESLLNETGIDIQFKDSGLIKIANQEDDLESLTRQYEFLRQMDSSVKLLSNDELIQLTNGNVEPAYGAIHIPNDGQINANKYTKALFKSLQQHHITRYYHQEVQSIDRRNGYYAVCTDQMSPIEAHKVIVASGAWSSQLLKLLSS